MAHEQAVNYKWIVSKKDDLTWIIGSSGVSLFLLASYFFLTDIFPVLTGVEVSSALVVAVIFLIWTLIFDSTHFFATYSRTFLDKAYLHEHSWMLFSSLMIFVLGPMYLILTSLLTGSQHQQVFTYAVFALIIFGSLLWGYFHLIRQHWGFVALYQKKNKETKGFQYKLDATLLFVGSLWPFIFYLNNEFLSQPLLLAVVEAFNQKQFIYLLYFLSSLSVLMSLFLIVGLSLNALGKLFLLLAGIIFSLACSSFFSFSVSFEVILHYAEMVCRISLIGVLLVYAFYYLLVNKDWNIPKFLLIGSVLFTHNIVLLSVSDFLLISACLTIFHNIQYHRIVRYFNVNHYKTGSYGLASLLTQKLGYYILFSFVFSLFVFLLRGSTTFAESGLMKMIFITSVINGVSLHHYFIDGLIWRTSKDLSLSSTLKL